MLCWVGRAARIGQFCRQLAIDLAWALAAIFVLTVPSRDQGVINGHMEQGEVSHRKVPREIIAHRLAQRDFVPAVRRWADIPVGDEIHLGRIALAGQALELINLGGSCGIIWRWGYSEFAT